MERVADPQESWEPEINLPTILSKSTIGRTIRNPRNRP